MDSCVASPFAYLYIDIEKDKEYNICIIGEKNQITILLLEYDEFGCMTCRFGETLIDIETYYDKRFYMLINSYITIEVEDLKIYDENI